MTWPPYMNYGFAGRQGRPWDDLMVYLQVYGGHAGPPMYFPQYYQPMPMHVPMPVPMQMQMPMQAQWPQLQYPQQRALAAAGPVGNGNVWNPVNNNNPYYENRCGGGHGSPRYNDNKVVNNWFPWVYPWYPEDRDRYDDPVDRYSPYWDSPNRLPNWYPRGRYPLLDPHDDYWDPEPGGCLYYYDPVHQRWVRR